MEGAIHAVHEFFDAHYSGWSLLLVDAVFNSVNYIATLWNTRVVWP